MQRTFLSMRYCTLLAAITACFSLGLAPTSQATIIVYNVNMNGPNEAPANNSPGIGSGTVTIDTVLNTMAINVSFSGLTGTTTAAHIHAATALPLTGTAGVATQTPTFSGFPLGVSAGTYVNTYDLTLATSYNAAYVTANGGTVASAQTALLSAMDTGRAYFNIHSSTFGGGEIRGFLITAVPEPSSILLTGLAAVGCVVAYRRKRRKVASTIEHTECI